MSRQGKGDRITQCRETYTATEEWFLLICSEIESGKDSNGKSRDVLTRRTSIFTEFGNSPWAWLAKGSRIPLEGGCTDLVLSEPSRCQDATLAQPA